MSLLRKLLYCERCGARMHGTPRVRRYMCSTRRYGHSCGEPIVKARELEALLGGLGTPFSARQRTPRPPAPAETTAHIEQPAERRGELLSQLQRLRDLYVLGDLTKPQYVMRRQAIDEELQRLGPSAERARAILDNFRRFWDLETEPAERRKLLLSLFSRSGRREDRSSPCSHTTPFCRSSRLLSNPHNTKAKTSVPKAGGTGSDTRSTPPRIEIRL